MITSTCRICRATCGRRGCRRISAIAARGVALDDDGVGTWVCGDANWGRWAGGKRDNIKRSYRTALERAGLDNEGELRPTIAELRLLDMDSDNIEATVMYGPVAALDIDDPELRLAVYAAYNDWLIEFCAGDPKRLIGVAMLPAEDAAGATAELRRLAERGETRQVSMHIARAESPIYGPDWTEFWDVIDEIGDHRLVPPRAVEGDDDRHRRSGGADLRRQQGVHPPVPRSAGGHDR